MKGKTALLAGAAVTALMVSGAAFAATTTTTTTTTVTTKHHHHAKPADVAASPSADKKWGDQPVMAAADTGPTLEQRVQALEDKQAADHTRLSTVEQNANDTSWSFDNARPTVKSGDGRFTMSIRARFQFDNVNFFQDTSVNSVTPTHNVEFKDLSSGSVVRRAFLGVEGKAFSDFWYELRLNAGGSDGGNNGASGVPNAGEGDPLLSLARVAYLGIPNFRINVGVIEPTFMYEGTTSSGQLMFLERPEIDNIAADTFGAGDARRGIELLFQKESALLPGDNLVLAGDFTGNKTGSTVAHGNLGDEQSQALAHATYRIWSDGPSNISFGGDYSHAFSGGISGGGGGTLRLRDRPEFRVDGSRLIDTTAISGKSGSMWAVNGGANFDNFYVGGEYADFTVDRQHAGARVADTPDFSGWYVEGSWVLTGEPKTYTVTATNNEVGGFGAPKVASPFSLAGNSWGAWELTARYSDTDLNWNDTHIQTATTQAGIAGGKERVLLFGLNWYMNQNIKLQVNDAFVDVSKHGAPTSLASIATQRGQNLNILGVRLQFTN